jgi:hypothetical protein
MKKLLLLFFTGVFFIQIFGQQPARPAAAGPVKSREIKIKKGQTLLDLPVNSSSSSVRATI